MAEFDQDRGKLNAGSAPIEVPAAKKPPLKNYVPDENADPVVKEAYKLSQEMTDHQMEKC